MEKKSGFRVPLGVSTDGIIVRVEDALKEFAYKCPNCDTPLSLRKGQIKRPHFAHQTTASCDGETVLHKGAKLLVQQVIREYIAGQGKNVYVERRCSRCRVKASQFIPHDIENVEVEYTLPNGRRPDVCLLSNKELRAAIEILVTHKIDYLKGLSFGKFPWIEVTADAVIENPYTLIPVQDYFLPFTCNECAFQERINKHQEEENENYWVGCYWRWMTKIAKERNIELPKLEYRYAIKKCWVCTKFTLVFTWAGHASHSIETPPGDPKKFGLQRHPEHKVFYWANHCMFCDALQGDGWLYQDRRGVFNGFIQSGDSRNEFADDLRWLMKRHKALFGKQELYLNRM